MTVYKRTRQWTVTKFGFDTTIKGAINLPPGKKLYQCPVQNGNVSDFANKGYGIHINAGSQKEFQQFGRHNVGCLLEVSFIRSYAINVLSGKGVRDWSDSDFTGFGNFVVSQVGCDGMHSSFNEAYNLDAPYGVDMAALPVVAYKMQKAIGVAARAAGYNFFGEYSGIPNLLSGSALANYGNFDVYRQLIGNDQATLNCLKGQPGAGQPSLMWSGDLHYATDLHQSQDTLINKYNQPGGVGSYMSGPQYIVGTTLASVMARQGHRALGNTTAKQYGFGWMCKAQPHYSQTYYRKMPDAIGGIFKGTSFPGYSLTAMKDVSGLSFLLDDGFYSWGEADQIRGNDPGTVRPDQLIFGSSDQYYFQYLPGDGPGSKNPGRANTAIDVDFNAPISQSHPFDASVPKAYPESPMVGEDMPKEAAFMFRNAYDWTNSLTPYWFPVRKAGQSQWGRGTAESAIDAIQQGGAFAVGLTDGDSQHYYKLYSCAKQKTPYQVLLPGGNGAFDTTTAAFATGKDEFCKVS